MRELEKDAGTRCKFQKFGKGCIVYHTRAMPACCSLWSCRWLVDDDCADIPRPDHAHYVLDIMPDYITTVNDETGERREIQVAQIWCDPGHLNAWKTPALLNWIERRAKDGIVSIIRYGSIDGIVAFAPCISEDGKWNFVRPTMREKSHSAEDIARVLGPMMDEEPSDR